MTTALGSTQEQRRIDLDERSLQARVRWFVEKWTVALDLKGRDSAELSADLVMVVQAVHRDASRETHALLLKAFSAMPPAQFIVAKKE